MSVGVRQEYLSVGGNRNTAASVWLPHLSCLAYGADCNIALWQPLRDDNHGVQKLIKAHADKVTVIAYQESDRHLLLSGAADGELRLSSLDCDLREQCVNNISKAHEGAVTIAQFCEDSEYFITGGADTLIKVWKLTDTIITHVTTIKPKPRFIPLALASGSFKGLNFDQGFFIIAAGTRSEVFVYSVSDLTGTVTTTLGCSLTGHEGWIRSLALNKISNGDYLLASASADKYVRLWRLRGDHSDGVNNNIDEKLDVSLERTLTAKVKTISIGTDKLAITFEALLLGHEDWVYSVDWQKSSVPKLLTASADGTLAIWESDSTSGIWISETHLGEISGQKGATTATGSSGGFWKGLWVGDENTTAVISLGRTGSWRLWHLDAEAAFWQLHPGIGGHIDSTNGLAWSRHGSYLLSTSSDQTTRLHAEWKRNGKRTWHEFSRCQIHGYNCNVVTSVDNHQFVSGADEKLLRVFDEPRELADTLYRLCDIPLPEDTTKLPESAAIPVLGLSNKEMGEPDDIIEAGPRRGGDDYAASNLLADVSLRGISEPPTEDLLSRHTLWPESEKLYGHGYEISEAAYGHGVLATACKATSLEHATIRLYDAENDWRSIEPPLTAHSLTVTRLTWSHNGLLLSVGRDRQWTVFRLDPAGGNRMELLQSMPKAHTRMILDAAWSPVSSSHFFATAGRDKTIKIWTNLPVATQDSGVGTHVSGVTFHLGQTLSRPSAVTALDFASGPGEGQATLAVGEEEGRLSFHILDIATLAVVKSVDVDPAFWSSRAVNRLAWRPGASVSSHFGSQEAAQANISNHWELAVAGADGSVCILAVDVKTS